MELARKLGERLQAGDVLTLEGDLGAGKTTFTKGLGQGLGVKRTINSPTFTIVKEYEGRIPLYHIDAYRLEDSEEDIGFEEYFQGDGVTVVEWAQFIQEYLPERRLDLTITYLDESGRFIEGKTEDPNLEKICEELFL
ncbi:tRNA threonylcarbamoyladenosine biosynthesis protein TsaE [Thalassobacillus cyri]|uniref:tRNA threonylcarbamoyladenosine biosynthesis protein TsaE n=2 Tax=Thalassobacillus cyri TaxID=571932 RepID=A0A1H4F625_9BACI|nr:tRNA threonylcarbamoyladenosine biosynthesis protein TsaE [Thalassobacillus cyri]